MDLSPREDATLNPLKRLILSAALPGLFSAPSFQREEINSDNKSNWGPEWSLLECRPLYGFAEVANFGWNKKRDCNVGLDCISLYIPSHGSWQFPFLQPNHYLWTARSKKKFYDKVRISFSCHLSSLVYLIKLTLNILSELIYGAIRIHPQSPSFIRYQVVLDLRSHLSPKFLLLSRDLC